MFTSRLRAELSELLEERSKLDEEVDNVARLPRERLLGATVGARLDLVPPRRVSVTATFDVLLFGMLAREWSVREDRRG